MCRPRLFSDLVEISKSGANPAAAAAACSDLIFFSFWTAAKPGFHFSSKKISFTSSGLSGFGTKMGRSAIGEVLYEFHRYVVRYQNLAQLRCPSARFHCEVTPGHVGVQHLIVDHITVASLFNCERLHSSRIRHTSREPDSILIQNRAVDLQVDEVRFVIPRLDIALHRVSQIKAEVHISVHARPHVELKALSVAPRMELGTHFLQFGGRIDTIQLFESRQIADVGEMVQMRDAEKWIGCSGHDSLF